MTDFIQISRRERQFRVVFGLMIASVVVVAVSAGFNLNATENCILIPVPVFTEGTLLNTVVDLCVGDLATFWILSLALSKSLRIGFSSVVFFIRGLVIGGSARVITQNSVSWTVILFLLSYVTVTCFAMIFDGYLNTGIKKGFLVRILACLITTGAAVVIRVLPALLLEL